MHKTTTSKDDLKNRNTIRIPIVSKFTIKINLSAGKEINKLFLLIISLGILLFIFQTSLIAATAKDSISWLKVPQEIQKNWKVTYSTEDLSVMTIKSTWSKDNSETSKKIYSIVPKKSSSYKMATAKLLEVLHIEGIPAEITIINFAKKDERGISILKQAEAEKVDLIFTMGSESAELVHKYYKGKKIPVVTCTNKDPVPLGQMKNYTEGSHNNIATTSLNVPLDIQLSYLFELVPELENIGLMYNKNHKQVMATEVIPAKREFTKRNLNVIDVAVESRDTSKEKLKIIIPQVINQMRKNDPQLKKSVFWITSSTAIFSQIKTINMYSDIVPVVSSIPNAVKKGDDSAVLAIGIDRRNNAHLASIYAVKILRGEVKPGDLIVGIVTPPDVAINFRIAKKIGLKIPFRFFESAAFIYDYEGEMVRSFGETVEKKK